MENPGSENEYGERSTYCVSLDCSWTVRFFVFLERRQIHVGENEILSSLVSSSLREGDVFHISSDTINFT